MKKALTGAATLILSACVQSQQTSNAPMPARSATAHLPSRSVAQPISTAPAQVRAPQNIAAFRPVRATTIAQYMDRQEFELRERLRPLGLGVARPGDQLVLSLLDEKVFDGDSAEFSDKGKNAIATIATILRQYDHTTIEVRAFTDGGITRNVAGPQERARAVAKALVAQGVQFRRVFAQGYGATRRQVATGKPIVSPRDRRVEIRIQPHVAG